MLTINFVIRSLLQPVLDDKTDGNANCANGKAHSPSDYESAYSKAYSSCYSNGISNGYVSSNGVSRETRKTQ